MNIIEISAIESLKQTIVYDLTYNQLEAKFNSIKQEAFYQFFLTYPKPIDYAIISLRQPYRNTLYALYPHIKICIHPDEVKALFYNVVGLEPYFYEEVAATGEDEGWGDSLINTREFIKAFYNKKHKEAANALYKKWASEIPLGIPNLYKLIRVMEFYMDEILMYFEVKELIDEQYLSNYKSRTNYI